jgi:hypothetical protein
LLFSNFSSNQQRKIPIINGGKFQPSMVENSNHQWWKIPTINGGKFQPSMVE